VAREECRIACRFEVENNSVECSCRTVDVAAGNGGGYVPSAFGHDAHSNARVFEIQSEAPP
jgi:hypothetical protein